MLKFLSEPACSLQLDLHWGSVFASQLRTRVFGVLFSFLNWILSGSWSRHRVIFSKLWSKPACSSQVHLQWASPHLPWGMQGICRPLVLKTIIMSFKRLFVLWHSLIRSLYFIQVYIFTPLIHSAPFLCFSLSLLHTNIFLCILPCEIFFLSLMMLLLGI